MSQRIDIVKDDIDSDTVYWEEYYRYFHVTLIINEIYEKLMQINKIIFS